MNRTAITVFDLGRRALTAGLILGLMVSAAGCASKYGPRTVQVKHYPACYAPIERLRQDETARTSNTVAGAIIGGLIGAAIGYNQGGGRGAAIGGISGAVIGGGAAYLITDSVQKKNQAERFAAYSQALDQDIRGLSNAVAAARLVSKCYEDAYKTLKRQYQAGQVGQGDMAARLKELRDGTNDANTVLAGFAADIAENQLVYQDIQKSEIKKGARGSQMAVFRNKGREATRKQSELQQEIQRMKTISATMDSDYRTIHADTSRALRPTALAALPASVCRPAKM